MKKFLNMTEFAAHLGLSRGTVSNILNQRWKERNISPKTAERVLAYAKETHFTPNFFGRAIQGKFDTDVAVLLPINAYEHHKQAFFNLLNILEENEKQYYVFPVHNAKDNRDVIARLVQYKVKKAIVIALPIIHTEKDVRWWMDTAKDNPQIQWCFYDFQLALLRFAESSENVFITGFHRLDAYKMVYRHVANSGYRNILISPHQADRELKDYIMSLNLVIYSDLNIPWSLNLYKAGRQIGEFLCHTEYPRKVTAVFIPDDTVAIGAIQFMLEHDMKIPADYGIISWDGLEISKYSSVPLTTLEIPVVKMMEAVTRFILDRKCKHLEEVIPHIRQGASL